MEIKTSVLQFKETRCLKEKKKKASIPPSHVSASRSPFIFYAEAGQRSFSHILCPLASQTKKASSSCPLFSPPPPYAGLKERMNMCNDGHVEMSLVIFR